MPLFEVTDRGLRARPPADFVEMGFTERGDLQRILRDDVTPLGDDLLVIAEEFGDWEDARRRIDLLAIDRSGRLVVIELKRTETGGHMDLQAIRYAAMVSAMDADDVVATYARHLGAPGTGGVVDAFLKLQEFLDPGEDDELTISSEVRIILAGRDFGREITTTVLWLNGFEGMDVRCVRVVPYEIEGRVLLDVEQVLPLPEAADYQVQIRRKEAARERVSRDARDFTRFHVVVDGHELPDQNKRNSMRSMVESLAARGVPIAAIHTKIPKKMKVLEGIHRKGDDVREALAAAFAGIGLHRWFTDSPFVDEAAGKTYVLSNQWGIKTEERLQDLVDAFPEATVTFHRADPVGD